MNKTLSGQTLFLSLDKMSAQLRLIIEEDGIYINEDVTTKNNLLSYINGIVYRDEFSNPKIILQVIINNISFQVLLCN